MSLYLKFLILLLTTHPLMSLYFILIFSLLSLLISHAFLFYYFSCSSLVLLFLAHVPECTIVSFFRADLVTSDHEEIEKI
jgi:hypothetical protein